MKRITFYLVRAFSSDTGILSDFRTASGMRSGGPSVVAAILIAMTTFSGCVAELYTALADMEELLETEAVLIDTLNGYIKAQEERLATLRK